MRQQRKERVEDEAGGGVRCEEGQGHDKNKPCAICWLSGLKRKTSWVKPISSEFPLKS